MHAGDLNLRTNLHCSRQILTLAAAWSCAATSSTNAFNGVGCHHAPRRPRSNPHSARSTTACHFPRFPSLEAFGRRPQASVSAAPSVIGRHPKPFTKAALCIAARTTHSESWRCCTAWSIALRSSSVRGSTGNSVGPRAGQRGGPPCQKMTDDVHNPGVNWYRLHNRDGLVRRRMRFARMQVVDADVRIYVQEVRAVHTVSSDGGMRPAVRLPGMPRAFSPCHPDRARLPHHVARSASGRRKVRAHHRKI